MVAKSNDVAALGFRAHSGWAVVAAVAGSLSQSEVLERCRIETADAAIPGSKQPYHTAQPLEIQNAEKWISRCRDSSTRLATSSVSALLARITERGYRVVGAGILFAAGRPLPDLAVTLRSHALIHTAEGEFFRQALVSASEHCALPVMRFKERDIWEQGAAALGRDSAVLRRQINEFGRSLGPPWRQDEKLATLAGWIVLAQWGRIESCPTWLG